MSFCINFRQQVNEQNYFQFNFLVRSSNSEAAAVYKNSKHLIVLLGISNPNIIIIIIWSTAHVHLLLAGKAAVCVVALNTLKLRISGESAS